MSARWWLVLALAGCGFQVAGSPGDATPVDAAPDGLPATCTPAQTACNGRVREVCGSDGRWDPAQATTCDFTCAAGACVGLSNVPLAAAMACGSTAPRLAPAVGTKVTVTSSGGPKITCDPHCGEPGLTEIPAAGTMANAHRGLVWFCLGALSIPGGVVMGVPASGGPSQALAFIVDGDVALAGTIDFDGGDASGGNSGGVGAPGGWDGANRSGGNGNPGDGPCPGQGGANSGSSDHWIGGGGGGGGFAGAGARGGDGRCSNGNHDAVGRDGGGVCGDAALIPLLGGSGGGSGGDGTTGTEQGWAGGGGGGAIQISGRTRIDVTGAIRAAGGSGYGGSAIDGGGGGGAGGAILLEAPVVTISGALIVDGGSGGMSGAGAGGAGATELNGPGAGLSQTGNGQGGSGGGGAGGRVRINTINATCPATASPVASCTTGALLTP